MDDGIMPKGHVEPLDLKSAKVEREFRAFLERHRHKEGQRRTHTGLGHPCRGSFCIEGDAVAEFMDIYRRTVQCGILPTMVERPMTDPPLPCPILADFDIKIDKADAVMETDSKPARVINKKIIRTAVRVYQEKIAEIYEITDKDKSKGILNAYVFLRPSPYIKDGAVKDGLHLMFPMLPVDRDTQLYLREQIIKDPRIIESFKSVPAIKQSVADIIDIRVLQGNGWMLYGSSKPGIPPYHLEKVYTPELKYITKLDDKQDPWFYSIQRHPPGTARPLRPEHLEAFKALQTAKEAASEKAKAAALKRKMQNTKATMEDIEMAIQLTQILSPDRAVDYSSWIEVGFALHNIAPDCRELMEAWDEFSRKCPEKYRPGVCEEQWLKLDTRYDGLTLGSIRFWASQDDPEAYHNIMMQRIHKHLTKNKENLDTERNIAQVLYKIFGDKFVYVPNESGKNGLWYVFQGHRWELDPENLILNAHIIGDDRTHMSLTNYYQQMIEYNNNRVKDVSADNKEELAHLEEQSKTYYTVAKKLQTSDFLGRVVKMARIFFKDKDFYQRLDSNPLLLGFNNGIYDFRTMEFRDGQPGDYVTTSVGYDYVPYDPKDEHVTEINVFMAQILTKERVREYVWKTIASYLVGLVEDQKFRFWTGSGGNGKSLLNTLIIKTLGGYQAKLPITLLTGKRTQSSQASPEVAATKGKRYVYMEESDKGDKINVGLLKEMTGGDELSVRDLFKPQAQFKPQFKICMLTNHLPPFPPDDGGMIRRVEVVHFSSKFVDDPDPSDPLQFKKDVTMPKKIEKWPPIFMSILIEKYKDLRKEIDTHGMMQVPMEVQKAKSDYLMAIDPVMDFYTTHVKPSKDKKDSIKLEELYGHFVEWAESELSMSKKAIMNKKEFKDYIRSKILRAKKTIHTIPGHVFVPPAAAAAATDGGAKDTPPDFEDTGDETAEATETGAIEEGKEMGDE